MGGRNLGARPASVPPGRYEERDAMWTRAVSMAMQGLSFIDNGGIRLASSHQRRQCRVGARSACLFGLLLPQDGREIVDLVSALTGRTDDSGALVRHGYIP